MRCILLSACLATLTVLPTSVSWAQVTPDGTLNTAIHGVGNSFTITNGTPQGGNLFHSFQQFSIPTGGSATFDLVNTPNISTIFSRVTGGRVSNIDGVIQTTNGSNPVSLFLINPAGILFGPNASLNIGGSFIGTTANSIKFADGTEFSAVNSTGGSLLTVSAPIGLQMGPNPGGITVQGANLQIGAGNTLALVGGAVNFSSGLVSINGGGHLEVGSVREGIVRLSPLESRWIGDYSAVWQFNDIHLAQQSRLDSRGSNGSIQIQGRNINLSEGSGALIQNLGTQASGGITVHAVEFLNLTGNTPDGRMGSFIQIENSGMGQTGDITISATQLLLQNGGVIRHRALSPGSSGNLTINVTGSITVDGFAAVNPKLMSAIGTSTLNSANAGNITISTGNLSLFNGGNIASTTFGSGQTGTVRVNARDLIEIAGINSPRLSPSVLSSTTIGSGNANNTVVNTSRLVIRDGGFLGSNTVATGSSGSVIVNASESVEVKGNPLNPILSSRIISSAETLDAATRVAFELPAIPSGKAGSLTINTPLLRVTDGAYVTVKNDGPSQAGGLQINANSIFLDNQSSITASTASGNGGNINLNVRDLLLLRHGSNVTATAGGSGNGGNITIKVPVIAGFENSDIVANAVQGRGGNIQIATQGIFGLKFRPQLTADNDITASSQFGINGTVQVNTIGVDPSAGLVALPVDLADSTQQISTGCSSTQDSSFVATGRGGLPQNPIRESRTDRTWADTRDLSEFRTPRPAVPLALPSAASAIVEASTLRRINGQLELVAVNSSTLPSQAATCAGAISSSP
jgi:filamentous hemagglutinin family protein